ncbi:MAG: hypothetical protein HQL27_05480 [Candidatus Omnitrophica bacterium]|nr:hypothetical protein [Candidatus Omnitrophota bacterium]
MKGMVKSNQMANLKNGWFWANQQADRIDPLTPSPYSVLDEKEPTDIW